MMLDEGRVVGDRGGASLRRLRRRLLWGTAALVAVLFVLWWRWNVDAWFMLGMVGFSVGLVTAAALAGLLVGALIKFVRRLLRGSSKLDPPIGSGRGRRLVV